ncbi:MAG: YfbU family protein [Proteobacteria bacterium]|nr:YfbU family protein [Pseudomonadota bacterium]
MTANPNPPKISAGERIIMLMIQRLCEENQLKSKTVDFIMDMVEQNHLWALSVKFPALPNWCASDPEYNETCDILDMWHILGLSYERLPQNDKAIIDGQFGKDACLFPGFDIRSEGRHFDIADVLQNKLQRYVNVKSCDASRPLQSLGPILENHRRALPVYKSKWSEVVHSSKDTFNASDIKDILSAWYPK